MPFSPSTIRTATALAVLAYALPSLAADPHPPQLAVGFTAEPAPIIQGGQAKLFYEMTLTNTSPLRYTLVSVEVHGG
jgi:hypothetical protein